MKIKKVMLLALASAILLSDVIIAAPVPAKQKQSPTSTNTSVNKVINETSDSGRFGIGIFGVTPTIRYNFSDQIAVQLGLRYDTISAAGSAAQTTILANLSKELFIIRQNKLTWGIMVNYVSNSGYASGVNTTSLMATFGIETKLNPDIVMSVVIMPVSYSSYSVAGSSTSLGLLNNAVFAAHIYI